VKSPKAPKCKKRGTKQTEKRTPVYSMTAKSRQSVALFDRTWEHAHLATPIFHSSAHVCKSPQKHNED